MNRRELFLSAAGAAVATMLPAPSAAAAPLSDATRTALAALQPPLPQRPFSVFTERGLYVGCHPSPWTPDNIRAMIETGDPCIRWGTLDIPAGSYVRGANVFCWDRALSDEELRRLTA